MRIYRLLICFLVFAVLLTGCGRKTDNTNDIVTTNSEVEQPINNDRYPSFVVETISAAKGNQDVVVRVSLKDNPGFLTMAMDITYDYENMSLTKVVSGSDYSDYYFVGDTWPYTLPLALLFSCGLISPALVRATLVNIGPTSS